MKPSENLLKKFSSDRLIELGEIATLAGSIEFRVERIIWLLSNENVVGIKPTTDTRSISNLIDTLHALSLDIIDINLSKVIKLWTDIAKPAFRCRNSILHGLVIVYEDNSAEFITNTRWKDEIRKRSSASFHVTEHTLTMLSDIFQLLYDIIFVAELILEGELIHKDFFNDQILHKMSQYYSNINEIVDLDSAYTSEKY
jgi:hypothetical protein